MKKLFSRYGEFDVKAEAEKNRKVCESTFFTGYLKKHPGDNSLLILVVSESWQPLTTLEFSQADVVHHEILDEEKGKVRLYVQTGARYMQCSYLTVKAAPAPEIPGISRVFRGEDLEAEQRWCGCHCSNNCNWECGCDCGCKWECDSNESYVSQRNSYKTSLSRSSYASGRNSETSSIRSHLVKSSHR